MLKVDKEDPQTWKKYTKGSCETCRATCCTMPIEVRFEDLLRLNLVTEDDLFLPLKKLVITAYREESGLFAFKQTDKGVCRYLVGNRCGVYKTRPLVCRAFPIEMGWRHGFCPQEKLK